MIKRIAWIVCCTFLFVGCSVEKKKEDVRLETGLKEEIQQIDEQEMPEEDSGIQFPYLLDMQHLLMCSFSTASVPNPDADGVYGENIACLEVKNTTGEFVEKAVIHVRLEDESTYVFEVENLPVDKTVQSFDIYNTPYDGQKRCDNIAVTEIQFLSGDLLLSESLAIEVDDLTVTVHNFSENNYEALEVICLCDYDGTYFGGKSYVYRLEDMSAGKTAAFDAVDCYLGKVSVVRILAYN